MEAADLYCSSCGSAAVGNPPPNADSWWVPMVFIALLFITGAYAVFGIPQAIFLTASTSNLDEFLCSTCALANVAVGVWSGWTAIQLFKRKPGCLGHLRTTLIMLFGAMGWTFLVSLIEVDGEIFPNLIYAVIFISACFLYFKRSPTVRHIYGANL